MKVRLSREAQADLEDIANWLAANAGHRTARRIARDLRQASKEIGLNPRAFVSIGVHAGAPVHRRVHSRWVILYRFDDHEVVIMRIGDGAQNYLAWFTDG